MHVCVFTVPFAYCPFGLGRIGRPAPPSAERERREEQREREREEGRERESSEMRSVLFFVPMNDTTAGYGSTPVMR